MKVVIYTPAYKKSPGTRYRVDMMQKALSSSHDVVILNDEEEGILRQAYRHFGPKLFNWQITWSRIGSRIGRLILKAKPDAVVLVTDITAGAIPFLKEQGVKTMLSIEDLTPVWLKMSNTGSFYDKLKSFSSEADGVITVSEPLREKLQRMGITSRVVPHGVEKLNTDEKKAIARKDGPITILNAGQIQFEEEYRAFRESVAKILEKYRVASYSFGRCNSKLKKEFPGIEWYNFSSLDDAVQHLVGASVGLVIRYNAERPTRIFFHASMLQPIVAIGSGWVKEVSDEGIGISCSPDEALNAADRIVSDYENSIKVVAAYAEKNLLPNAYAPLLRMLG